MMIILVGGMSSLNTHDEPQQIMLHRVECAPLLLRWAALVQSLAKDLRACAPHLHPAEVLTTTSLLATTGCLSPKIWEGVAERARSLMESLPAAEVVQLACNLAVFADNEIKKVMMDASSVCSYLGMGTLHHTGVGCHVSGLAPEA
jgi:hypothetical protein